MLYGSNKFFLGEIGLDNSKEVKSNTKFQTFVKEFNYLNLVKTS